MYYGIQKLKKHRYEHLQHYERSIMIRRRIFVIKENYNRNSQNRNLVDKIIKAKEVNFMR